MLIQPYPSEERRGTATVAPDVQPKVVRLADVEAQEVTWLWNNRIPCGKLTLLEGDPDVGASLVAYDFAARVSTGSRCSCTIIEGRPYEEARAYPRLTRSDVAERRPTMGKPGYFNDDEEEDEKKKPAEDPPEDDSDENEES